MAERWPSCVQPPGSQMIKPGSGEREVQCPSTSAAPSAFDAAPRIPVKRETTTTTIVAPEGIAVLPLPLAQRILAALETQTKFLDAHGYLTVDYKALAAELRACVEGKS